MPSSATEGKTKIKKIMNALIHSSEFKMLDLGCGRGTYGRLIEKPCHKVAVDAMDYREKFSLMDFYDEFYQHDIRDTDFLLSLGKFDLITAGDVLEHMTVSDAQRVLKTMEEMARFVIVAVPFMYPQKGRGGNHWEDHLQPDLTSQNMRERYPSLVPIAIYNRKTAPWNGAEFYGYYMYSTEVENGKTENRD